MIELNTAYTEKSDKKYHSIAKTSDSLLHNTIKIPTFILHSYVFSWCQNTTRYLSHMQRNNYVYCICSISTHRSHTVRRTCLLFRTPRVCDHIDHVVAILEISCFEHCRYLEPNTQVLNFSYFLIASYLCADNKIV